jgi:hypothetical protein
MQQAIIHRAEQLFIHQSIQSFHDGGGGGGVGGARAPPPVQEGGLGFPLPPTGDFVIQLWKGSEFRV